MKRRKFLIDAAGAAVGTALTAQAGGTALASATTGDGTTLVRFSNDEFGVPNGAWTWFCSERAIVDEQESRILVGSVSAGGTFAGDIVVCWYDVDTDQTGHFVLHEGLEQDDHDDPALMVRPDGRYLAVYAGHNSDDYNRWRVTTNPHDPTSWEPEQTFDSGTPVTYSNVHRLPNDDGGNGRTYNFTRTDNWDPNVLVSTDAGTNFSYGGRLLQRGDGSDRPYPRYASDDSRIHVTVTEEHPRNYDNSIYHGYVEDGVLYDSFGTVLDSNVLDGTADAPDPTQLTTVFDVDQDAGGVMNRGWTTDVVLDANGNPVVLFTTRYQDDWTDHRFFYARFDGSSWLVNEIAAAGQGLYDSERDYTGLGSIDPDDPSRVVISTHVDPRDGTDLQHHELFLGVTSDGGSTWTWDALTPNAAMDHLRPLFPAWSGDSSALVWMRGRYASYVDWDTEVVGMVGDVQPVQFGDVDSIQDGTYRIDAVHSGKPMEAEDTTEGANVQQNSWTGADTQQWSVQETSDGVYALENVASGYVADIQDASTDDGANALVWSDWGGDNQRFAIYEDGSGYAIEAVHSGKVLDVDGSSTSDGANVHQWTDWAGDNQRFEFTALSYAAGSTAAAINLGGDEYVATDGTSFDADRVPDSGETSTSGTSDEIYGTHDDQLYQSLRFGSSFTYEFDVPSGTYDVRLHFVETYFTSDGQRVFDVAVNGAEEISNLDVHANVGHDTALVETIAGVSPQSGTIAVAFSADVDNALVSGIEVVAVE